MHTGLSPQEYLAFERRSEERHEYADGTVFTRPSGTVEHAAITAAIIAELGSALFGKGCRVLTSDMRIHIPTTGRYVYPDGSIVCGRPEFLDDQRDTLLNPRLVLEVLSDSTEAYDRGDKFAQYRTIPSFQEYVLASQKEPRLEVFTRQPDGSWLLRIYGPGERAVLSSAGCSLEVDRVYLDVFTVEAEEARG